jgi:hypothetical protein
MNNRFKICNKLKKNDCIELLKNNLNYEELKNAIEPTQVQIIKLMNAFTKSDLQNIIYNTAKININIIAEAIKNKNELINGEIELTPEVIIVKKVEKEVKNKEEQNNNIQTKITIGENISVEDIISPFDENKKELLDYNFYYNEFNKITNYKALINLIKEEKIPKDVYEKYFKERKQDLIVKLNKIKKGDWNDLRLKDLYELHFINDNN